MAVTLVVETGAIVSGANTYISLDYADTYHANLGRADWANADEDTRKAALTNGTRNLDAKYAGKWIGRQTDNNSSVEQVLAWPREELDGEPIKTSSGREIGINTIPMAVKNACAEAAFLQLEGDIVQSSISDERYVKKEVVGELETEWFESRPSTDSHPVLDGILEGLASSIATGVTVVIPFTAKEIEEFSEDEDDD